MIVLFWFFYIKYFIDEKIILKQIFPYDLEWLYIQVANISAKQKALLSIALNGIIGKIWPGANG